MASGQTTTGWRWVVGVTVALLVVGLLLFARGRAHHRGQNVGERTSASVSAVVTVE